MKQLVLIALLLPACSADTEIADTRDAVAAVDTAAAELTPEVAPPTPPPAIEGLAIAPDLDPAEDVVEVHLKAAPLELTVIPDEKAVHAYAYEGQVPGPLIVANVGDTVVVHFENGLDEPTTVHWHGLRIPDTMDGSPRIQTPVPPGGTFTYRFTVPDAGTFWYHPHVRSNEQIEKGLYGMFIVREREPPAVTRERAFVLDDILLDENGALAPFFENHMEAMHGRSGNTLLNNGQVGRLRLEARQGETERWRIVNVANARTMELSIEGATWRVCGSDGGIVAAPYETKRLTVAVGQRYDLEVVYDRSGEVVLSSYVLTLDENGDVVELSLPVAEVAVAASDEAPVSVTWPAAAAPRERPIAFDVTLELDARSTSSGLVWRINGEHSDPDMEGMHDEQSLLWAAPSGTSIRIVIDNLAGPEHPFHLHGQFFEIVGRNGRAYDGEPGLKDVVLVPGMESVELIAYLDNPGRWMAHCHILEHAALGMMAEFRVE